jgi:hypothetical protein
MHEISSTNHKVGNPCDISYTPSPNSFDFSPRTKVLFSQLVALFHPPPDLKWTLVSSSGSDLISPARLLFRFASFVLDSPNLLQREVDNARGQIQAQTHRYPQC